jgi:hypothetical protein
VIEGKDLISAVNTHHLLFALVVATMTAHSPLAAKGQSCIGQGRSCPIDINLGEGSKVVVRGRLTRHRMIYSYRLLSEPNRVLIWKFRGPAIRTLITYPDGHVDGPGLPREIPLSQKGSYVFSVSSNTMADRIYGRFTLQFTIKTVGSPLENQDRTGTNR